MFTLGLQLRGGEDLGGTAVCWGKNDFFFSCQTFLGGGDHFKGPYTAVRPVPLPPRSNSTRNTADG